MDMILRCVSDRILTRTGVYRRMCFVFMIGSNRAMGQYLEPISVIE